MKNTELFLDLGATAAAALFLERLRERFGPQGGEGA